MLERQIDEDIRTAKRVLGNEDSIAYSKKLLEKANATSEEIFYSKGVIESAYELGRVSLVLSDNPGAIQYFYLCLKESRKTVDSISESKALKGLGLVMYNLNKWPEAIENFENSILLDPQETNYEGGSTQEYLLGLCYYRQGQLIRSKSVLQKVRDYAKRTGNTMRETEATLNLTNIKAQLNPNEEILLVYDSLIGAFDGQNEKMGVCFALEGKASALYQLGELEASSLAGRMSLDLAKNLDIVYPRFAILDVLIQSEYDQGNFRSAANYMMELRKLKEKTINEKSTTEVVMQMADFKFDQKEEAYTKEIDFNKRQRVILIILVIVFFGLGIFVFLSRRSISKERKRSDILLHNILPDTTIEELKVNGTALAKAHPNATIVFADVKSFTKIASELDPQTLVKMLDVYFSKFDKIVDSNGLEKIKTIGDAYMFVSGLDNAESKLSAKAAVRSTLEMINAMNECASEMKELYGVNFQFRFGVHTGEVVSGVVGSIKYAFDIWRDAVNIAARMEEHGEPGKVNVSGVTHKILQNEFRFVSRGETEIKNRGTVEMFFVEE